MFWKVNCNSWSFFRCFFLNCELIKSAGISYYLLDMGNFSKARLTTSFYFFHKFFLIWEWLQLSSVNCICLVYKVKFLSWTCSKFWRVFKKDLMLCYLEINFLVLYGACEKLLFGKTFFKTFLKLCVLFIISFR